ncbi:MAG: hypothetical protein ABUS56_07505, partial [Acidobacteriota bacterium]
LAVGVSSASLDAATFCDAVLRFYIGDPATQSSGNKGVLPVGMAEEGTALGQTPMLTVPLAMKKPDGQPMFARGVRDIMDTADVPLIFRNALLTQQDGDAVAVLAGPATNMVRTLALNGGRDAIAAKVGVLVMAGGAFPSGPADPRIRADVAAARRLLAEWPTPIVAVGTEVGEAVRYPGYSIDTDFAWAPAHPIAEAYRAYRAMPYDAPAQAVAAALYASNQKDSYFQLSAPGTIQVLDDGRTQFSPSDSGRHRYLIVDPAQKDRIVKAFTTLVSAKPIPPAPRVPRPRPGNQAAPPANTPAEPPKPLEAKE